MSSITNMSRRDVLKLFGIAGGGLVLGATGLSWSPAAQAQNKETAFNLFVAIGADDKVYLTCDRSEMGQGIRTGVVQVLADELEADWSKIEVLQALGDKRYGDQNTDGSRSIRQNYTKMRQMGATARVMLEQAAASRWQVPLDSVYTKNQQVHHKASDRSLSFGALAIEAGALPMPKADTVTLKNPKDFTHIGKPHTIVDMDAILNGTAIYGYDIGQPDLVFASILRPPVYGSDIATLDDTAAKAVAGVIDVIRLPVPVGAPDFQALGGAAVVASNNWSALEGKKALKVSWKESPNSSHDSKTYLDTLKERVQQEGELLRQKGSQNTQWPEDSSHSALYSVPYLAHQSMEPPAATAWVKGDKCEIWAPTQNPQAIQDTVAKAIGIKAQDVVVHVTLLGGAFGRKAKADFAAEAALLSKATNKPVKVSWSREDDIQHDYLHAISAQFYQARLDDNKMPQALLQRTAFPSISSTFTQGVEYPAQFEVELGFVDVPFALDSVRCEAAKATAHTRIGWFRSVCNIFHAFGINSFVDELAVNAGIPATQMWKHMLGSARQEDFSSQGMNYGNYGESLSRYPVDVGRYLSLIDAVDGAMKNSDAPKEGQGWGFAVHRSFVSYAAVAILIDIDKDKKLKVLKVITAIDAGQVVNPDRVKSQLEGAVIMGLSLALMGEITFSEGKVMQNNFNDAPVLRMPQTPADIEVIIMESSAPPGGVGEPGMPPVAPSLANAIFAVTGERHRDLPLKQYASA